MTKKRILIVGLILIIIFSVIYVGIKIAPGSYVSAERYNLPYKEDVVIEVIEKFKKDNPQFNVPMLKFNNGLISSISDGRDDDGDHWYGFYFYDKELGWLFATWIREAIDTKETTFALVAVSKTGLEVNWKDINDGINSMSRKENKEVIKRFEELFLAPIEVELKKVQYKE